ncbi:acyltransferase [Aggregatimonas sangjinii]|uniref:Acyltransferase n=1 Tax=Aggregatimonas sangjinii TaxID=2583587 RepID=A0A5B7SM26_9FLAO|nr:acyltransferase [Aggregatimonas sangjinii]QCW99685.1 acyltransferase [Aggregatimonas sangjinii]
MQQSQRRYDIDWWRVIAIIAVYLHHICMPFNGDGYHIVNAESSKVLDDVMVFFEQIRLPLLFLISGTATVFAFSKRSWWQFVRERSYRLLIPLVFGLLFIVPPQTYYEHIEAFDSFGHFYAQLFSHLEVNHLWFIENLFYISLGCIPLILFLRSQRSRVIRKHIEKQSNFTYSIFLWALLVIFIKVASKIYFPEDSKSITNLSSTLFYGFFFIAGIVLATVPNLWGFLKKFRRVNLIMAIIGTLFFYGYYYLPDEIASEYLSIDARWAIWHGVSSWISWSVIISLLGYGQIWFNRSSKILTKANEAIYPFYILHQTVIVAMAYYIVRLDVSILWKITLLLGSTFPFILLVYRFLIYPFKLPRILFGIKKDKMSCS